MPLSKVVIGSDLLSLSMVSAPTKGVYAHNNAIFGKEGDGYHARSALGFAALPTGAAVEVEAIFEVKS